MTGIIPEPNDIFVYWHQIRKFDLSLGEIYRNITWIHGRIPVLIFMSTKFCLKKMGTENYTNNTKYWNTDLELEKSALSMWYRLENDTCKRYIYIYWLKPPNPTDFVRNLQENNTNPRKNYCTDINLDKFFLWIWEYSNKINTEYYTNQTMYSYTDLKLKKSAILREKLTGKWHEPK